MTRHESFAAPATARRRQRRGPGHYAARAGLVLLALAVLALPFYAATEYYLYQKYMSTQVATAPVELTSADTDSWAAKIKSLPATSAPVVLAYHDIGHNKSSYVVTPKAFEAQMAALEQAGYRSLTTDEFVDYLKGGPAPPRSVYITFDDGPNGLWVYGDRILARHHMHGTVFLITGRVDRRPYYLSWNEIKRMAGSGRWDFQDHTHDLHLRGAVDAAGHTASMLANRLWLKDENRLETREEYEGRVTADIKRSFADFADHGLPKPQVFAYPFSEATEKVNVPSPGPTLQDLMNRYFAATMTNDSSRPLTAGRRAASARVVQRLEVVRTTKLDHLMSDIAEWTQVAPSDPAPLSHPARWTRDDGTGQHGIGALTGTGPAPSGSAHYVAADYRDMSSVDWTGYRVDATIGGLGDGTNQGAVQVRGGSLEPVDVSVSQGTLLLSVKGKHVGQAKLVPATTHRLRVTVQGQTTTVQVDGTVTLRRTSRRAAADITGGIGIRVGINRSGAAWPRFTALAIKQLTGAFPSSGGARQSVTDAHLMDPAAQWLSAPGVKAPFRISHTAIEPTGRTLSAYGAYQPGRTQGWTGYTVTGTVQRLSGPGVSGAIWVRVGSALAISVQVGQGQLNVLSGDADNQQLVGTRRLTPADSHRVSVTVTGGSTEIAVDGSVRMTLMARSETGGVAYSAYRDMTRHSWPTVGDLKVTPQVGS
ncbi:polysaccharide deacetylase family protein [Streptomyces sp. Ag109_G2-15]|uniref:polysaccharide deacetylase family protein n=1 Tax=Streptomyces sp. Ag109_G2-15 TaxID=1938850 RepID=UPI000BCD4003|nr:polysaccharide deacetylase family protein [Streptomyces sp. Ag109_G2-15]SOD86730.1 Polysaccharide deacetylase [Streptomyces sp. Ag109_G2-15]